MNNFTILKNKYGRYAVGEKIHNPSCPVIRSLSQEKVWESKTIEFIIENINNESMIHAGTYFGDMLPAFGKSTKSKIFAFEANPFSAESAKGTIQLNNLNNIVFYEMGLGSSISKENLIYQYQEGQSLGGGSRFEIKNAKESRYTLDTNIKTEIDIITIDSIINEKISIIQLDIEGFEMEALKGGIETIKRYKPILILENVNGTEDFMQSDIIPLGYKNITKIDENTIWKII